MNNLLIGLTLFGSLSMRTPNDINFQNTPDYEVSLGVKNKNLFLNRQWERQDGLNFVDDEYWFKTEPGDFYFKPQYVNKTSRDLQYGKADIRYRNGEYSIGYTGLYSDDKFENGLSMGIQKKKEINGKLSLEAKWDGYYFHDGLTGESRFDMEDYAQLNWKLSDKLILTNIFDYNDIKGRKYYKFKIGVEYELSGN